MSIFNSIFSFWRSRLVRAAARDAFTKADPRKLRHNPVMLIVEGVSALAAIYAIIGIFTGADFKLEFQVAVWLWFTVLVANFSEGLAEGRGRAQAESLRQARSQAMASRLTATGGTERVAAGALRRGDVVIVLSGETIPGDGEITEGVALVDESAITGESAPVVREAGTSLCGVTGGTRLISGRIMVTITADPGETFLDQMIGMVESARRQKTPDERALEALLVVLTIVFVIVVFTLIPFANYSSVKVSVPVMMGLLICLTPTTIGGLLPAIGIAGMEKLLASNVVAFTGQAVEAAGNVDVVLMDKTGTITLGNRKATDLLPAEGVAFSDLARVAMLSSLADDTPEGRSILELARNAIGIPSRDIRTAEGSVFVPFSPATRMSGLDIGRRKLRKGAVDAIEDHVRASGGSVPENVSQAVDQIAREGSTPLLVADDSRVLGVIRLKDVLKEGIKERLAGLRRAGIRSVMITGDNPMTATAIAAEAGIDGFIAQASPEAKLAEIREHQKEGHMVAMIGDGTNDAPALAQADVAVAMNAGTQAAREAANMVDLDSNPAKLLDIVEIGKSILVTRGALTTFSLATSFAMYFTILPAILATRFPMLEVLNVMRLSTPSSAILSAIIFNALTIPALIPLALGGVKYTYTTAQSLLTRNLLIYGLGGLVIPFLAIKLIDMLIVLLRLD